MGVIKNIETYFKQAQKRHPILKKVDDNYKLEFDNSRKENINIVTILDGKGKPIFKAQYSIIGIYDQNAMLWHWGWNLSYINKNLIIDAEKVKKVSQEKLSSEKKKHSAKLKYYTHTSGFVMPPQNIPIQIMIAMYSQKSIWFYQVHHKVELGAPEILEFISIDKIVEKYVQ